MTKAEDFKNVTTATLLGLVNRWAQFEYEDGTGNTAWISSYTPETNKMSAVTKEETNRHLTMDEWHSLWSREWDVQIDGFSVMINGKKLKAIHGNPVFDEDYFDYYDD